MRKKHKRRSSILTFLLKGSLFAIILGIFSVVVYLTQGTHINFPRTFTSPKQPLPRKQVKVSPPHPQAEKPILNENIPSSHPLKRDKAKKIAIVIDDVGYDLSLLQQFLQLDIPLTFAVLPNLRYSAPSARLITKNGRTVILHMPMQPERDVTMDDSFITVSLSPQEIAKRIDRALRSVPGAVGVSNHMGSLVTQRDDIMDVVMINLAKHNLFFLDSLTTPNSVGPLSALKAGVPILKRDVFIDNEDDPKYVVRQLEQLASIALKKGKAIGIGHLKETTLEGIKLALPYFEEKGIKVVSLNELLM